MFQSFRHSQIALRIGLAIVFVWYGVDKLIQPQYWLDAWVPLTVQGIASRLGAGPGDLIYLVGIFEILVAISLATGFFMRYFSAMAVLFLGFVMAINGFIQMPLIPD